MAEPPQEEKERHLLRRFAAEAADVAGSPADLAALIRRATSHPFLFSFASFLSSPSLSQLDGSEHASSLDLLRLFAYGTWSDYKRKGINLPTLVSGQILKLKQLTVLTLAKENKILFYDQLMLELDVLNERELEDFLIDECMHAGIVRGKLNHLDRYFEVQFAAARDLKSGQLNAMIQSLSNWLSVSDNLLVSIQDRIERAVSMSEASNKHRKEIADKVAAVKNALEEDMLSRKINDLIPEERENLIGLKRKWTEEL